MRVLTAVPTPFSAAGELDTDAARALFRLCAGTADGLFVAGTTGEFPALDDAERLALFGIALAEAGPGRVIAHVGAPDAHRASRLAAAAAALGARRLAAITPYHLAPSPPGRPSAGSRRRCGPAASARWRRGCRWTSRARTPPRGSPRWCAGSSP